MGFLSLLPLSITWRFWARGGCPAISTTCCTLQVHTPRWHPILQGPQTTLNEINGHKGTFLSAPNTQPLVALELVAPFIDNHWCRGTLVPRAEHTPVRIGSLDEEWSVGRHSAFRLSPQRKKSFMVKKEALSL